MVATSTCNSSLVGSIRMNVSSAANEPPLLKFGET